MSNLLDSDAYRITRLVHRLSRVMGGAAGAYAREQGVSAADRALMELLYPDRRLSVPELARRYQVSRQHVQTTVNALMREGLMCARDNPKHKRSPLIMLDTSGRERFEAIVDRDRAAIDSLFAGVSQAEARQTCETLRKLLDNAS